MCNKRYGHICGNVIQGDTRGIVVAGGQFPAGDKVEFFDGNAWTELTPLPMDTFFAVGVVIGDELYIAGGGKDRFDVYYNDMYVLRQDGVWQELGPFDGEGRANAAATLVRLG